ncbi:MAG: DUF1587 domain-containing protein [Planctomycetales bacterium]|nr:DUF1587 domain-containing protein [Planctomycetales bacterium]
MKNPAIIGLLILGITGAGLAADGQEAPISLEAAREHGRAESRFLKESTAESTSTPSDAVPASNVAAFRESVEPVLKKSCLACHGPEKSEGRLRIDQLNPDLLTGPDVERWREVFGAISKSEMPPEDAAEYALADADRGRIVDWLTEELRAASLVRRNIKEHSSFRRLTNYEYNYALQDLLGLPYNLANNLPPESTSEDGFKNSSELLQMSVMQFQIYRETALKALKRATVSGERPPAVTYIISMPEEFEKAAPKKEEAATDAGEKKKRKPRNQHELFHVETGEIIDFFGGEAYSLRRMELWDGPLLLGTHRVQLHADGHAFIVTSLSHGQAAYQEHLKVLLTHTRLKGIQWINFNHFQVEITTIEPG